MRTPIKPNHHGNISLIACFKMLFHHLTLPVLMILILYIISSCATVSPKVHLPPVAESYTGEIQEGHFVWIDLLTEDTVAAASFYSRLFGWQAARSAEDRQYYLFYLEGKPIAGMAAMESQDPALPESLWLTTITVRDVNKSVTSVTENGGKVLEGPLDAAGRGHMALVSDKADAPFILLEAGADSRVGRKAKIGQWHWIDLITQDGNRAKEFYSVLFGFQVRPVEADEAHQYELFLKGKRAVAGIVELQWEGLEDNWLPYFKVADVDRTIASARNLGGKLILQTGKVAVLADPTGAAFGVQMR